MAGSVDEIEPRGPRDLLSISMVGMNPARCLRAAGRLGLLAAVLLGCSGEVQTPLERYRAYVAQPGSEPGAVHARFLGTATLLLDDGETAVMTDGFFSRPPFEFGAEGALETIVAPDVALVEQWLARLGIERLAAVMTVHSHYDHAMDTPVVAERTGATVLGSRSTANIARGWGLAEDRIVEVQSGEPYRFGAFTIKFLASSHAQLGGSTPMPGEVSEPLVPPAPIRAYREGGSYSILIEHTRGTALVQGSAGYVDGALEGVDADVVFLGIGGLGGFDADYRASYWRHTVEAVNAGRVLPIHWDDFTIPLAAKLVPAEGFEAAMDFAIARSLSAGILLQLPPALEPIVLY